MKIISTLKRYSLGTILVTFLLGLAFASFPSQCKDAISAVIGASLIVFGVFGIISFIVKDKFLGSLITSIITIILGVIICLNVIEILNIIVGLLGASLLIFGLFELFVSLRIITVSGIFGWISLLLSILSIIFGCIAIANTNETTVAIFRFLGIALIVFSVLDTISYIQVRRIMKEVNSAIDEAYNEESEIETSATIIDE